MSSQSETPRIITIPILIALAWSTLNAVDLLPINPLWFKAVNLLLLTVAAWPMISRGFEQRCWPLILRLTGKAAPHQPRPAAPAGPVVYDPHAPLLDEQPFDSPSLRVSSAPAINPFSNPPAPPPRRVEAPADIFAAVPNPSPPTTTTLVWEAAASSPIAFSSADQAAARLPVDGHQPIPPSRPALALEDPDEFSLDDVEDSGAHDFALALETGEFSSKDTGQLAFNARSIAQSVAEGLADELSFDNDSILLNLNDVSLDAALKNVDAGKDPLSSLDDALRIEALEEAIRADEARRRANLDALKTQRDDSRDGLDL